MIVFAYLALQTISHEFVYEADRDRHSVSVAGSFNNWDRTATHMNRAGGRLWKVTVPLAAGRYQYKFVLDGETWIVDPRAARNQDDGNGNVNSILDLLPPDYGKPARRDDGILAVSALRHETVPPGLNFDRGNLMFSFRTRVGDVESVTLVASGRRTQLDRVSSDDLYDYYRGTIPWKRGQLRYRFIIRDGRDFTFGSGRIGGSDYTIDEGSFRPITVPGWTEGMAFYQIFPERFANGDKGNDPANVQPWGTKPTYANFMGGDLAGIRKHAGYLKELGVGGIYINPIFEGPSNHGYETSDYKSVAKRLGSNRDLRDLVRDLHGRGLKVVLDGVFNHTATTFAPFADIRERGQASPYVNWYWIHSFPVRVGDPPNYTAWSNFPSMPKVNLSNAEARKFFLSLPGYWKRTAGIDGWRLDVANEVSSEYWRAFRNVVKAADPQSWIVGEVWGDGTGWLKGDQWDSIMGYQFRDAVLHFVAEGKSGPKEFLGRLFQTYDSYAPQVSRNLMNLLSSHDTPRFLTLCGGDRQLAQLGAALQFTWPGSPSIYYGEELGMEGGPDPANRTCMEWNKVAGNPMLAYYKKLISLRRNSKALRSGDPLAISTNDAEGTLSFARVMGTEAALVAVNRSGSTRTLTISTSKLPQLLRTRPLHDELANAPVRAGNGSISVTLAPRSASVLLPSPVAMLYEARDAKRATDTLAIHPSASLGGLR